MMRPPKQWALNLGSCTVAAFLAASGAPLAWASVRHDAAQKAVTLTDGRGGLSLRVSYGRGCVVDRAAVRGRQVLAPEGAASGIKVGSAWHTSRSTDAPPRVAVGKDSLSVSGIAFGPEGAKVREEWLFAVRADGISWTIRRAYPRAMILEDLALPLWSFASMETWKGGILGNGGVVWSKYLESPNATRGAHTGAVTLWNAKADDALRIVPRAPGLHEAVRFSHQPNPSGAQMLFAYSASPEEARPKHALSRFLGDRQDVWAPFSVQAGQSSVEISLQALKYSEAYSRGTFKGVNGESVRELLNTVGRYGVIDTKLVGANGWRSGYICLHEPFFAQIGAALNDANYDANLAAALDYARDHAIKPDGRVMSRWKNDAGDAMPGTYNEHGFYEAQWGYLLDSQPDYVINVAQQFDITGDKNWLAGHKISCERALKYLTDREVNGSGLVAMMTDSRLQNRGSDWFDIVWASYENAWVNASLYHALTLWAEAEDSLNDAPKAAEYRAFAARLKRTFNLPLEQGGFWDAARQRYIYWRDKDGSVHGGNLFTAVNFAAINFGICDDAARRKAILDSIEAEMQAEKLFYWPTNFTSFEPDEVASSNMPFPRYENGDLFLTWGALGIGAYASHEPALALKYLKNVLARYEEDGLSFQRYSRREQAGQGDDILAGNGMAVVGLYREIYGVRPKPNRLVLAPRLTPELNGTQLLYNLRGQRYTIDLSTRGSSMTSRGVTVRAASPFGMATSASPKGHVTADFFPGEGSQRGLSVTMRDAVPLAIQIGKWSPNPDAPRSWTETASAKVTVSRIVAGLRPGARYAVYTDGRLTSAVKADGAGAALFGTTLLAGKPCRIELTLLPR